MANTPRKTIKDPFAKERAAFHANKDTKDIDELKKILEAHGFGTRPQASADDVEKLKKEVLEKIELPEVDYGLLKEYIVTQIVNKFAKIKQPKDGKDGKSIRGPQGPAGKDGRHAVVDLDALVSKVLARLPKQKEGSSLTLAQVKTYLDEAIKKIPAQQQIVRVGGSVASIRALTDVNLDGLSMDEKGNYILGGGAGDVASVNGQTGVVVLDADDIDDTTTTHKFATAGEKTKLSNITVTQAVDLDQMEIDIAALANGMVYKGNWDASAGTFPGAGVAQTGWFYTVSVGGTVDGVTFVIGDRLIAIVDNASATVYAANWTQLDATDAVTSVAGRTGNVTLDAADIAETAGLKIMTSAERTKLSGIETAADVTDAGNVGTSIDGATAKTTPVDADTMPLIDSAASNVLKKVTWANIKATLLAAWAAIASELNTGTSTAKFVTPDALAGSNLGIRYYPLMLNGSTALTTSDKVYFRVPAGLTGMNLVSVTGAVGTGAAGSSSSGTPTFTVKNVTDNNQMLSTSLTIDASEYTSASAATPAVINASFDDVVTDDLIEVACTVAGTGVTYATVTLGFQLP